MQELVDKGDMSPTWRDRLVPGDGDMVFADHYPDRNSAISAAETLNVSMRQMFTARTMDDSLKRSLELKIDKMLQAKQRLQAEESLMLQEAIRRHADDDRRDASSIKIAPESERHRHDLSDQLTAMPYLKVVKVGRVNNRWSHDLLYLGPDDVWSKRRCCMDQSLAAGRPYP